MNQLEEARKNINAIDQKMAKLFEQRMAEVAKVSEYKIAHGLPILDRGRENEVIVKNSSFVADETIRSYYVNFLQSNMDISRRYQQMLQKGLSVAYSGVEGAFANIAAKSIFPDANQVSFPDFRTAYDSVVNGECDCAVLPIENSSTGGITEVYDLLRQYDCHIVGEQCVKIEQNLLGCEGATLQSIKTVYSHPQGFKQSKDFFRDYPHMEQIPFFSTSKSAEEVAEKQDITLGAVAGKAAADLYNLKIIAPAINSNNNNYTRFIIIAKRPEIIPNANKITLIVAVKHETGSLYKMLASFYHTGLNLMNLESRPMVGKSWEYFFFIDVTGNLSDPLVADVIDEVRSKSTYVKILGNYRAYEKKE